jgi:integrase
MARLRWFLMEVDVAYIEKRGPRRWRARYRAADGRERSKTFELRAEAERWLASVQTSQAKGEWVDPALGRRRFKDWADEWTRVQFTLRPSTLDRDVRIVRNHLIPYFGDASLSDIDDLWVRDFVAEKLAKGGLAPATVRKLGQVLSKVMRAAVEAGFIARSPCDRVRLPAERHGEMPFITLEQIHELVDAVEPIHRALIYTAAFTGMRWGELAGLRLENVDLDRRRISVVEQLNELNGNLYWGEPKTKAGRRMVRMPESLAAILLEHIQRPAVLKSGLVFPSRHAEPMRRSTFTRRVWAPAVNKVGLDGLRFHDLRHTAVALAIAAGAHPKALQARMGHSSVSVTLDRYGHLYEGLDAEIADSLDRLMRHPRVLAEPPTDAIEASGRLNATGVGDPDSDNASADRSPEGCPTVLEHVSHQIGWPIQPRTT